jgi:5'-methylthioadenosine phosphorylase
LKERIGVIGGSGLYHIEGIKKVKEVTVATPFGRPSDAYITGELEGREVIFLPRHGRGHRILPSELNFRANIYGFKKLGVSWIISVSAVGSLREDFKPQDIVLIDQFFDRTHGRKSTFFGEGIVAHIGFSHPICPRLRGVIHEASAALKLRVHNGGTYVNMEGPAFSTYAESVVYRKMGFDIIGMTNLNEAKLAREAEICYATLAMVTDYDCWREEEEVVSVDAIIANLNKNAENAKRIIKETVRKIPARQECTCKDALKTAIMTPMNLVPAKTKKSLLPILRKYL